MLPEYTHLYAVKEHKNKRGMTLWSCLGAGSGACPTSGGPTPRVDVKRAIRREGSRARILAH